MPFFKVKKGSVQGLVFLLMLLKQEPGSMNCVNCPTVLHKSSLIDCEANNVTNLLIQDMYESNRIGR